jgi:hypothetical protein
MTPTPTLRARDLPAPVRRQYRRLVRLVQLSAPADSGVPDDVAARLAYVADELEALVRCARACSRAVEEAGR